MQVPLLMAAGVMMVSLAACSAPVQREFGKAERDSVTKVVQDFAGAYNAKDAAKAASFFTGRGAVMPPNASTVRGTESVQEYFAGRFAQGASDLVAEPQDVAGSGTLAYVTGNYSLRFAPAGGPERRDRGKFLWVLRELNGRWLLEYVIFSSDFSEIPTVK